jgi:hypothetical protein
MRTSLGAARVRCFILVRCYHPPFGLHLSLLLLHSVSSPRVST